MPRHYPKQDGLPRRTLLELQLEEVEATLSSPETSFFADGQLLTLPSKLSGVSPTANMALNHLRNDIYDLLFRGEP